MRLLALDIGHKRTGCAFYEDATGIPLPLDTLTHHSLEEFTQLVSQLIALRRPDTLIIGLPLLPSGAEGTQSQSVRAYVETLSSLGLPVIFFDERYTTPQNGPADGDAIAACAILTTYLEKNAFDKS